MARSGVVDISLIGDKELERKLRKLPPKVQKQVVRPALVKVAKRARDDITAAMPVDTGKLKSLGMKVVPIKRSRSGGIGRLVQTPTKEELGIPNDSKSYYPAHVELGHSIKGGGKVADKPYIRGTMKTNRPKYLSFLRREIGRLLIKVAKKA